MAFLMVSCDDLFDFYPPTIKVLEPAENANVKDSLDIKAIVEDNVGVEHVEFFFLDGNEKLAKTIIKEEPYERKLKTMSGTLGVKAFDEAGNHSTKKIPLDLTAIPPCNTFLHCFKLSIKFNFFSFKSKK